MRRAKFLLLGAAVVGTMGLLLAVGIRGGSGFYYYLTVSEFLDQGAPQRENLRVNGRVVAGTIARRSNGARFVMAEGGQQLPVDYTGVLPDTFVDDAEVVVQGQLRGDGVFEASLLLAKCPSKYEAADDPAPSGPRVLSPAGAGP